MPGERAKPFFPRSSDIQSSIVNPTQGSGVKDQEEDPAQFSSSPSNQKSAIVNLSLFHYSLGISSSQHLTTLHSVQASGASQFR
jgi:hypothetical protein